MHILVPIAQRDSIFLRVKDFQDLKKLRQLSQTLSKNKPCLPLSSLIGLVVLRRPKVTLRKTQRLPGKVGTKWFHMVPKSVMVPESLRVPGSLR